MEWMMSNRPLTKVVLHYGIDWCVFSACDRYEERPFYKSRDRNMAAKFARALGRWIGGGCQLNGSRPLGMNADGSVFYQRDFDARTA